MKRQDMISSYLQMAVLCSLIGTAIPCSGGYNYDYSWSDTGDFSSFYYSSSQQYDYCSSSPCQNEGTCTNLNDGYYCTCYSDLSDPDNQVAYRGEDCEYLDKCLKLTKLGDNPSVPCDNGGICVNRPNDKGYDCTCATGYSGKRCKTNIDDCDPDPCENEAECHDLVADYYCDCDESKTGKNCSFDDECNLAEQEGTVICANDGICHSDESDGSARCNCTSGYIGQTCLAENPCNSTTCPANAICVPVFISDTSAYADCSLCLPWYMGQDCEWEDPCEMCEHGTCTSIVISSSEGEEIGVDFTCTCEEAWEGTYCDQIIGIDDSDSGYWDNECYEDILGRDYRGSRNVDLEGNPCQNWTAQTPWQHDFIQQYPFRGLGNHNFCRNPSVGEFEYPHPFCISTTNETIAGQIPIVFCNIGTRQRSCERRRDNECFVEQDGSDYRGTVNVTISGAHCLSWAKSHFYSLSPAYGLGDHNYCRTPDFDPRPWCITSNDMEWEYCDIGSPSYACDYIDVDDVIPTWRSKELVEGFVLLNGADYRGQRSVSVKGGLCLNWWTVASAMIAKQPDAGLGNATHSHNYCRNPDNDKTVWCYVNTKEPRAEYCDIGFTWDCEAITDPECHVRLNGEDYRGRVNNTQGILTNSTVGSNAEYGDGSEDGEEYTWCIEWDNVDSYTVKYPEFAGHNFCRNPGGKDKHPWCFTGWSNVTGWEWSYCGVSPWSVLDIFQYQEAHAAMTTDTMVTDTMVTDDEEVTDGWGGNY